MRIAIIGGFARLYDEEYIARSFESLGHEVLRLPSNLSLNAILSRVTEWRPEICLFNKFEPPEGGRLFLNTLAELGIKSVCWIFDLYFGYPREHRVAHASFFRAEYVFTTDGGHDEEFKKLHIPHRCVRQGIYKPECVLLPTDPKTDIAFVGSDNGSNLDRVRATLYVMRKYGNRFLWYGRANTHELRGMKLNQLYAQTKVIIGDSVYSPFYWSNRVVETLGRGGFLIHVEVPGIKEEYPDLVTYKRGDMEDLFAKIDYYLEHEDERREIVLKNFSLVSERYTMDRKCEELLEGLNFVQQSLCEE